MTDERQDVAGDEVAGADVAVGGIEAGDVFGLEALDGDFHAQSGSIDAQKTRASGKNEKGDEAVTATHDLKTVASCPYIYTGAGTETTPGNFDGLIPLTYLVVGSIMNGYHVDQISVVYSNGAWPVVTFSGHNHTTNAHTVAGVTYTPPASLLACGFGCPEALTNSAAAVSSPVSMTYTLACEHTDVLGKTGEHLSGANHGGMETLSIQHYGTPVLDTAGWVVTSGAASDSNADFDQTATNLTRAITRD
jgi:hypothetical protein